MDLVDLGTYGGHRRRGGEFVRLGEPDGMDDVEVLCSRRRPLLGFDNDPGREIEIVLINRKDLPSAGAGETGIVGLAPAVGNAIFAATGTRLRGMPMAPVTAVPGEPASPFKS